MTTWTPDGRCPCGGTYDDRAVEVRFSPPDGGEPVTLPDVPQGACSSCGSRVYAAGVLQRLELAFKDVMRRDSIAPP